MRTLDHVDRSVPKALRSIVQSWVDRLLQGGGNFKSMPGRYWDLSQECPSYLGNRKEEEDLGIEACELEGPCYFIRPRTGSPDWGVVVYSAASALQCERSGCRDTRESIVEHLVQLGIPFRTPAVLPSGVPCGSGGRVHNNSLATKGLGYRQKGYCPDITDYRAYVMERDAIITGLQGRAALLKGGLVWRLVIERLGTMPAMMGPTAYALEGEERLRGGSGKVYYDDVLSVEELDCICGVYCACKFDSV